VKKQRFEEKETSVYQCCICEEESNHFQICCGHPMMVIESEQAMVLDLKKQSRRE
jgi:hypothetical protein